MLSDNIKYYRQIVGINQTQLAEKLHVTQGAVSQWERGFSRPDTDTLIRLANVLNVSLDDLMKDEKEDVNSRIIRENAGLLEALHQNPRLGLLLERSRKMDESQINAMLSVADAITKERENH